jgi:stage V sporulation protein B
VSSPKSTTAGRGVIYIAFAKFWFMFAGLVVQFRLPAILSHAAWGSYSVVASLVSPVNNVLVTGTIQTVSRFSAHDRSRARQVQHAGLRMHSRFGLPVAGLYIAAAPVMGWLLHDTTLVGSLMLGGVIVGGNAFYATFVGTANGLQQFNKQAGLDISFATMRTLGLIGMATAGLGVMGVVAGWLAAVGAILAIAAVWVGLPGAIRRDDRVPISPMLRYFIGVAVYLSLFNALMFVDTWLLKRLATDYFIANSPRPEAWLGRIAGHEGSPSTLADVVVGYYAAVQNLARLSYQAIIAATFVVFPLVSRSTFENDSDTTRRYVRITVRYSFMFATAIAVVLAANPADILGVPYAADYAAVGGSALAILAFGNVAFAVFAIAGTILNSAGFTRPAILIAAITLAVAAIGNAVAIPIAMPAGKVLETAAAVTSGAMLLGAVAAGAVIRRYMGAFLPMLSGVRLAIAAVVAIQVGHLLPLHGKLMTLVEAALVAAAFVLVLVLTREVGRQDVAALKSFRKPGAKQGD